MGYRDGPGGMGLRLTRRRFIAGAAASAAVVAADALLVERSGVRLTRHELGIVGLASALDGLTIAQVSDTPLPGNRLAARRVLDILARERPDIVAFTGDIVESAESLAALTSLVRGALGTLRS